MRIRCRVALIVTLVACVPGWSYAQQRTEQEIVELIVRDGPRARAIRAATDVVVAEQAARIVFPNPAASYTREGAGFTEFAQVEQPFPPFGLRKALERAGVAVRQAAEAERDARLWQLRGDALETLARLRFAQQRVQSSTAAIGLIEGLIRVLNTREKEGEGSRFDRVRAQHELVDAQQAVIAATVDRADARNALAALLPAGTVIPESVGAGPPSQPIASIEALLTRALAGRAELRALQAAAERFALEADVAKRSIGFAPTVSGGLKRADEGGETQTGGVIGVGITLPLFNRGTREAARWTAERARADVERTALEADIRSQITRATETLTLRQQTSAAVASSLASADELITIADVAYREGEIGILQLLDAYRTAARARERAVEANLNLRLAQIALERALGVTP